MARLFLLLGLGVLGPAVLLRPCSAAPVPVVLCGDPKATPAPCSTGPKLGEICTAKATALHPTQESLGMLLVSCKTASLNGKSASKADKYLRGHPIPAVLGRTGGLYITDHHHLSRALLDSEHATMDVYVCPQVDFSNASSPMAFWTMMQSASLVYLKSNTGTPIAVAAIPSTVGGITHDDPYRSLSEWVRDAYGYIKCKPSPDPTAAFPQCSGGGGNPPFLEFIWGDVVREQYPLPGIYTASPAAQVSPLLSILQDSLVLVQEPKFAALPHFNSGAQKPTKNITIDPITGCES